jgi:hypothetical protein
LVLVEPGDATTNATLRGHRKRFDIEVHLVQAGGSRLPGRLERGDIDVALMPAGEDRFSDPTTAGGPTRARARQAIANGWRIGDGGRGTPTTAASCAFRASISLASSTDGNSSARLATIDEMVWPSSGVRRPAPCRERGR